MVVVEKLDEVKDMDTAVKAEMDMIAFAQLLFKKCHERSEVVSRRGIRRIHRLRLSIKNILSKDEIIRILNPLNLHLLTMSPCLERPIQHHHHLAPISLHPNPPHTLSNRYPTTKRHNLQR